MKGSCCNCRQVSIIGWKFMLGKMSIAQLLTGLPTTEKKSHGIEVVGFLGGSENASPPRVPTSTQTGQVLPPPQLLTF